jgi:hypothetical protein
MRRRETAPAAAERFAPKATLAAQRLQLLG